MTKRFWGVLVFVALAIFLAVQSAPAQTVAGSILGTAVDQSGAVVPGAAVTLRSPATGIVRTAASDSNGVFHFPNLNPDTYTVTINANGFKQSTTTGIELGQGETRDLGKVTLQVGAVTQEVTVSAAVTPIQTSSSEKSTELTGSELNALPLRGRDLFGAVDLVPGVVDTNHSRDVTNPGAVGGITINGNSSAKNFTVDGITDLDTGSNGTQHFEPNMDAIQEVKVLSSNYQAEYGRNSGGTITVVTKSGTQQFHGSGWWNYRNNWMNANDWFNKASTPIQPRQKYRYNVEGYSIGGPIYIPNHFNAEKKHLFFFWSQEYTGQFAPASVQKNTVPTLNEIGLGPGSPTCPAGSGDFGGLKDGNGLPIIVEDPLNNYKQFPNNCIPASRIDPQGQKMLAFFPVPNYFPTSGSDVGQYNFLSQQSANHKRRNDVLRIDVNPTSKLTAYFRYINDFDDMTSLYQGLQFAGNEPRLNGQSGNPIFADDHPNPGHGYAGSAIWTISPTLVNEATFAEDWNTWSWYLGAAQLAERSRGSQYNPGLNPPVLFPLNQYHALADGSKGTNPGNANDMFNLLPGMTFGGGQNAEMTYSNGGQPPYFNENPIWTIEDNLSKVVGQHQFKMGVYWETNGKVQPAGNAYAGSFNFATSTTNPVNTGFISCPKTEACGDGYANGLLGYYNSYTQQTQRTAFDVKYQNLEFYVQDNWRVTRRLTLDLGIRFYHQTPQYDANSTFAEFVPSLFSAGAVPLIYVPACKTGTTAPCSAANQRAVIPGDKSGAQYPSSDIGAYVPGTGNTANGMKALGTSDPYSTSSIAPGPRIGFAYDVFGNGKTAIRGGYGAFFNRLDGNQVYGMSGNPPIAFTQADNFNCIGTVSNVCPTNGAGLQGIQTAGTGGLITPPGSVNFFGGPVDWLVVRNGSLGVQQDLGHNFVLDVAWAGNYTRHANLRVNLNPIPLGADFSDVSAVTGQPLTQNGSVLERTVYPGWQDINQESFLGYTNYNALDVSLQRRLSNGLLIGVAYTWSKALTLGTVDSLLTQAQNEARNYGPSGSDRRQNLLINYSYDLPNITKKWDNKFLGFALDHWNFSGLTTFQSGAPYTVTFSGGDITGSGTLDARPNYAGGVGNLNAITSCPGWQAPGPGIKYIFNPCAFTPPQQAASWNSSTNSIQYTGCTAACLGGEGNNAFYGRGLNNWDLTLEKRFPLGKEGRRAFRLQFQAYNAFNHPQFTGLNSTAVKASFNTTFCNKAPAGGCNNSSPLLIYSQTPHNHLFGQASSDTGYRILSGNVRFEF